MKTKISKNRNKLIRMGYILLILICLLMITACGRVEDPEASSSEFPDLQQSLATLLIEQLDSDLSNNSFDTSKRQIITNGAKSTVNESGFSQSSDINQVAPKVVQGAISVLASLSVEDDKIRAVGVITASIT